MNMLEIELRLSGIAETLSTRVMQAHAAQEPFLDTFAAMLRIPANVTGIPVIVTAGWSCAT